MLYVKAALLAAAVKPCARRSGTLDRAIAIAISKVRAILDGYPTRSSPSLRTGLSIPQKRVNCELGSRIYPLLVNSPQIKPNRLGAEAL